MRTLTTYDAPQIHDAHSLKVGDVVATKVGTNGQPQHARAVLAVDVTRKGCVVTFGLPRSGKASGETTYRADDKVVVVGDVVERSGQRGTSERSAQAPKAPKATAAKRTAPKAPSKARAATPKATTSPLRTQIREAIREAVGEVIVVEIKAAVKDLLA
jgi:hypothetical protein